MQSFFAGAAGAFAAVVLLAATMGLARRAHWRRRGVRRAGVSRLLRRIGARPEQERAILAELDALAREAGELRAGARELRAELAALVAAPTLDERTVASTLDGRLAALAAVPARAAAALARIHAILDPEQRARVAAFLRAGPGGRCGHAHAHAHA